MKKLVRLFLLCMIIIAIPIQSIAATAMLYCNTGHHQSQAFSNDGYESFQQKHQQHQSLKETSSANSNTLVFDDCSSCAACCIGSAVTTTSYDFIDVNPSSEKIDFFSSSHLGHISDGLERPPRA